MGVKILKVLFCINLLFISTIVLFIDKWMEYLPFFVISLWIILAVGLFLNFKSKH